jgi:TusA-related sulfurtransferase
MEITVDARGLSCPQPVLLVAKEIEKGVFPIIVKVDGATACENIRRFALTRKLKVSITESGDESINTIQKE